MLVELNCLRDTNVQLSMLFQQMQQNNQVFEEIDHDIENKNFKSNSTSKRASLLIPQELEKVVPQATIDSFERK